MTKRETDHDGSLPSERRCVPRRARSVAGMMCPADVAGTEVFRFPIRSSMRPPATTQSEHELRATACHRLREHPCRSSGGPDVCGGLLCQGVFGRPRKRPGKASRYRPTATRRESPANFRTVGLHEVFRVLPCATWSARPSTSSCRQSCLLPTCAGRPVVPPRAARGP